MNLPVAHGRRRLIRHFHVLILFSHLLQTITPIRLVLEKNQVARVVASGQNLTLLIKSDLADERNLRRRRVIHLLRRVDVEAQLLNCLPRVWIVSLLFADVGVEVCR